MYPIVQVVVCTDGLANVGLGSLDGEQAIDYLQCVKMWSINLTELKTEEQVKEGQQFYEKLGTEAVDKGYDVC